MSKYNILLLADPREAADALSDEQATTEELRAALLNALRRISQLQEDVDALRRQVPDIR